MTAEEATTSFQKYRWIIGVFLASTGSLISNLGLNLQKLTHVRASKVAAIQQQQQAGKSDSQSESSMNRNAYYRKPIWVLGLSLVIFGSIADFVALGFAAQTIVAPLGSLTLVSNVVFAPYFSGESVSRSDIASTMTIVFGSAIAVAFATHEEEQLTFDELFRFFTYFRFVVYAVVMTIFISFCYFMTRVIEDYQKRGDTDPRAAAYFRTLHKFHRFFYGAAAGAVGAQSVLFAKITSELVREGFLTMFARYETYIVLFMLGFTIFLQIKWLNQGLQRFDALYMVPVFQAFWIVFSVISGLVVYDEAKDMTETSAFMFSIGVIVTVGGVWSLSQRRESRASSTAQDESAPESTVFSSLSHQDVEEDLESANPVVEAEDMPHGDSEHNFLISRQRVALNNTIRVLMDDGSGALVDTALCSPSPLQLRSDSEHNLGLPVRSPSRSPPPHRSESRNLASTAT